MREENWRDDAIDFNKSQFRFFGKEKMEVHAPGKVLVIGGYAVLEQPNAGLVLSTSARFHSSVRMRQGHSASGGAKIVVNSPQYRQEIQFLVRLGELVQLEKTSGPTNKYVEQTIAIALNAALLLSPVSTKEALGGSNEIGIELKADNDFYSQQAHLEAWGLPYNVESLKQLEPFLPCVNESGEVKVSKTGLGSSAAMVSSLTSVLIFSLCPEFDRSDLTTLHAISQLVHGVIQGKIGSGFDVCAAIYGSMRYIRYDAENLKPALQWPVSPGEIKVCLSALNHVVESFELPSRLQLICGDVRGGSETPSMSRKVLEWRSKEIPGEIESWHSLIESNKRVEEAFKVLGDLAKNDRIKYDNCMESFEPIQEISNLRNAFLDVRKHLREIGMYADVPIEPESQTKLCDETMSQPGVIISGVPGAGGFDAVFAIVIDCYRSQLEQFWENRTQQPKVCALLLKENPSHPGLQIADNSNPPSV